MFKPKNMNKKRGFTFVELMISVSIFAFLSLITVSSYANFNNRIGVDTLAHQIAQFGHEAQVSALSVKKAADGKYPAYGLHFEKASSTQFIFFADLDGNGTFTDNGACGTVTSECEKRINLLKGVKIKALCGNAVAGGVNSNPLNCVTTGMLHESWATEIMFKRPNPDAVIRGKVTSGASFSDYSIAQVVIASAKDYRKSVQFYVTGQITVK